MADILGKDLDNVDDSLVVRQPFNIENSEISGPQFMTGSDFVRSAKIDSSWKEPIATFAQARSETSKGKQFVMSTAQSLSDTLANLPSNVSNLYAQLTMAENRHPILSTLSKFADRSGWKEVKTALDNTIDLLNEREYPETKWAQRVIANTTNDVETRKMVRALYNQSQGIDSEKWYNQTGAIIGAMIPAMAVGNVAFSGARAFGAGRVAATRLAENITKGYIGAEMAGQYAEETAAKYLERTGDKTFSNFTPKDATGLSALAYGAIGAQIEFMGGVEPIMAGALSKVGLRTGLLKAGVKIAGGEATEEFLQGITEGLMRKIDNTSDKTWGDVIKESLNSAMWGAFIGGMTGSTAFYTARRNLVKGIKTALPNISNEQAKLVADSMIDTTGEISSQDPTLRDNLRKKIDLMYKGIDIENKADRIDAMTDLEYSLIVMDANKRGIDLAEHELFKGVVNELGWFRAGIPEERRIEIQEINDNIADLKTQLAELNKAKEKDWEKIEEIENKLKQANQYVLEKLSDMARDDGAAVRRILKGLENKYVVKEKEKATKQAIKSGNVDAIRDVLLKAGFRTRDLSGTQVKELAKLNWQLLQDQDLGIAQSRGTKQVPLTAIEQNVESGNTVLLRAGYTQDQIDKMDDETWNRAVLTQYRKEAPKTVEYEYTEEDLSGVDFQPEQFDIADENARLDDIYPEYTGDTIRIIDPAELKQAQYEVIQRTNPMQDEYHVGIRSVNDIKTFDETIDDKDSFVWGDYSQEDAKRDLAKNEITIYSSKPIENGVFVSTSYKQAQEYAGGKGAKVYEKTVPLDYVAWISGDEGQFAITDVVGKKRTVYNSNGDRIAKSKEALTNFWRWFGDSKVVDEQGRPLVVYHGTNAEFSEFEARFIRSSTGRADLGFGYYFSSEKTGSGDSSADWYGNIIMPVYLKMENPFVIPKNDPYGIELGKKLVSIDPNIETKTGEKISDRLEKNKQILMRDISPSDILNLLLKNNYDGVISDTEYVVHYSTQIKSTDNRGTYSSDTGNIYKQNKVSGAAPSTYRGAYIPQYRFILRANRMDASTLSHEMAHDWFEINFDRYRSGKASKEFMRAWGALEKALGVPENATETPRQASEAFARGYEAWIMQNQEWAKLINVEDKDKDAVEKLMKDYQNDLRDIYNDISNPYFKQTWGKLAELKPELKAWFDRVVNITDLDVLVERGEITESQAQAEKLNRAIDNVIENTEDAETAKTLKEIRTLNDTSRYEVEGGNKNSLQERLSVLAKEIDENNMLVKGEKYDTRRDMMQVAEDADNFVKTRLDDALAIINGQMAEVEGLYREDIYTALERLAVENGDLNLLDELKNSEIANRLAKELGQRVAGFRNWKQSTDIDVVSALKSLDDKFNKALENKKAQKEFNTALSMLDTELKAQDTIADKELNNFLQDIECK